MFDEKTVRKVALLARLKLSDEESAQIGKQLGAILQYVEQLKELDVEGVEPLAHPLATTNSFRADEPVPSLPAEKALSNAPKRSGEFYAVPAILET